MTTILINFRAAAGVDPAGNWNNILDPTVTGTKSADLIDSAGATTGIALAVITAYTASINSNALTTMAHHGWPEIVWDSYWYSSDNTSKVRLSGFAPGQTGTIALAGYSANAARDTNYQINGGANNLYDNVLAEPPTAPVSIAFTADASGFVDITGSLVSSFHYLTAAEVTYTAASGPSITDVDTDNDVYPGQSAIATGTGFGAVQGTFTITSPSGLTTVAQTLTGWTDTTATFTVVNISGSNALPYGASQTATITDDSAATDTQLITVSPPAGLTVVVVADPVSDSTSIFQDATPAVAAPDQTWYEVDEGTDVVVAANGTLTASSATAVIRFRIWDATDETISAEYTATLSDGVVSVSNGISITINIGISFGPGVSVSGISTL